MEAAITESSPTLVLGNLTSLIDGMRRGDERVLKELYDATVGKLYALAMAILRNAEDAEEVVCSTYSYAWANAARYNAARATALGWLLMLCRSRALDKLRQRRASGVTVDIDEIADIEPNGDRGPDDLLALMQQLGRVRAALEKLTPERRRLVSLAFLRGMSHQEIANVTGMALGTVKSHVRRALQQLREEKDEDFVVLEGECQIGSHLLRAGDIHKASTGSVHGDVTTRTGVVVLIRGEYPYPSAHT
jgi:RNA polymerase sigma factor (sigma-70 family)